MRDNMIEINSERLLDSLYRLRDIGAVDRGVVRPAFSDADMRARHWLRQEFIEAGLRAEIDGVGNVLGISNNSGPAILLGSHLDTQPKGGWLDGALGVIYGLEVARTLSENCLTNHLAVDVVAFQDEESRFLGCLGSRSFVGILDEDTFTTSIDKDGIRLIDAIDQAGLSGVRRSKLDPDRYLGFLEAHIEQGPHLEDKDMKIGVVTSIVGLGSREFVFRGQQNHAGTTMMQVRKDAATALFDLAHTLNNSFSNLATPSTVWTMGRVLVEPGAVSIIPGYAELGLQYRDPSNEILDLLDAEVDLVVKEVSKRVSAKISIKTVGDRIKPIELDFLLRKNLGLAAEQYAPNRWIDMPSGAYHDAAIISQLLPAAMLFIPSIGGISHDFSEDSHQDDIILGCNVLAEAVIKILSD
tara:strand:+ start:163 stop:1398 length:1236 start_codon:yes stop_codon:yes gene_type:complete